MDYEVNIMMVFFGILIFLLYLIVFGILHGTTGVIIWTLTAAIITVFLWMIFK